MVKNIYLAKNYCNTIGLNILTSKILSLGLSQWLCTKMYAFLHNPRLHSYCFKILAKSSFFLTCVHKIKGLFLRSKWCQKIFRIFKKKKKSIFLPNYWRFFNFHFHNTGKTILDSIVRNSIMSSIVIVDFYYYFYYIHIIF